MSTAKTAGSAWPVSAGWVARHARNLATRVPGAELVAANSPLAEEREWARSELGVRKLYVDYAEMLADPDVDAVFLATPTTEHASQIIAALEAGKHVFSEKPTSLNLEDCLRVEEVAAKHPDLKAMIGYRAPVRSELPRCVRKAEGRCDRRAVPGQVADAATSTIRPASS